MRTQCPSLSIILPIYKTEKFLATCIDSILCQTYKNFELICVNDGSPDNSEKILRYYASRDSRIKVINQNNAGLSAARNTGLNIAVGEWVLFVDSDDKLGNKGQTSGQELQNLMNEIEPDIDMVVTQATVLYENNCALFDKKSDVKYFSLPFFGIKPSVHPLSQKINVCVWGKLYKRTLIEQHKLRFPVGLRYEDEYWFPCYCLVATQVKCINQKFYTYYRRNSGIMAETIKIKSLKVAQERLAIAEKIALFYVNKKADEVYSNILLRCFWSLFCSAYDYCPNEDRLYCYWKAGSILRKFNLNCSSNIKLSLLKQGKFFAFKQRTFYLQLTNLYRLLCK